MVISSSGDTSEQFDGEAKPSSSRTVKAADLRGRGQGRRPIVGSRFTDRGVAIRIFLTCWLLFTLHFATNTAREIYPALSLGDHLNFNVTEYGGLHPDIFEIPGRGSFINNNPGASIIGSIPYALLRPITDRIVERVQAARSADSQPARADYDTIYPMAQEFLQKARERGFDVKFGLAAGIMQAFAMAPISALGVVAMFWILRSLTGTRRASIMLSLLYAFATPIFYRTAQLNQNVLLANFALFAFVLLWCPSGHAGGDRLRPFYFLAGVCTGWTVVLDYSGLVAVAALGGYALARWYAGPADDRKLSDLGKFAFGIALCAAVLMAYQWTSFGNPILPPQSYMPAANYTDLGYRGFSLPQFDLLFQTAFGIQYGLFTSAPILLTAFLVPLWLKRSNRLLENRELIFVLSLTALFFTFCAANQYGRMQFNSGVRHIVPVVPFVFLLVSNVLIRLPAIVTALIGVIGTYWSWCLVMYRDVEQGFGVFESIKHITLEGFRLPWLTTLERMGFVNTSSAIPLLLLSGVIIWLIWNIGAKAKNVEFS